MGDSGAIEVLLEEQKSYYKEIAAPLFDEDHHYIYNQNNRNIRVSAPVRGASGDPGRHVGGVLRRLCLVPAS